jgi:hypothetical protein
MPVSATPWCVVVRRPDSTSSAIKPGMGLRIARFRGASAGADEGCDGWE